MFWHSRNFEILLPCMTIITKARVALEPILFVQNISNFWRGKIKFRKFQILAVVALGQHAGTKTLLLEIYVTSNHARVSLFADFYPRCMFLTLLYTATRECRPIIGRAVCLTCVCVVAWATCDRRRLSRWSHLFKLLPVTRCRVRVIRIWIKTALIFLVCIEITEKSVRWTGQQMILSRHRTCQTGLAVKVIFSP